MNFEIPTLMGNTFLAPPPPYLSKVLSYGGKNVPFPPLHPFIRSLSKHVTGECMELERVLVWNAFFSKPENDSPSKLPSLCDFPHRRLFVSKGTNPPSKVHESLGATYVSIHEAILKLSDHTRFALSDCCKQRGLFRGLHISFPKLDDYLSNNLVIEADKDGSLVLVSKHTYLIEAKSNMNQLLNGALVYNYLGPVNTSESWVKTGLDWQQEVAQWLCPRYPAKLRDLLIAFMDSFTKPIIPKFRLLVKSHKSLSLTKHGGFASRPLVGMFRWATTPITILLGAVGLTLLKLDRLLHHVSSPIIDSYDLLAMLRSHLNTHHEKDWVCSTIDFSAMYTRVTWSHVKDTFVCRRNVYSNIHRPSTKLTEEEFALLDFFFSPIDSDDIGTLADTLTFLDKDAPSEHLGILLLNYVFHQNNFRQPRTWNFSPGSGLAHGDQHCPPMGTTHPSALRARHAHATNHVFVPLFG